MRQDRVREAHWFCDPNCAHEAVVPGALPALVGPAHLQNASFASSVPLQSLSTPETAHFRGPGARPLHALHDDPSQRCVPLHAPWPHGRVSSLVHAQPSSAVPSQFSSMGLPPAPVHTSGLGVTAPKHVARRSPAPRSTQAHLPGLQAPKVGTGFMSPSKLHGSPGYAKVPPSDPGTAQGRAGGAVSAPASSVRASTPASGAMASSPAVASTPGVASGVAPTSVATSKVPRMALQPRATNGSAASNAT